MGGRSIIIKAKMSTVTQELVLPLTARRMSRDRVGKSCLSGSLVDFVWLIAYGSPTLPSTVQ
jgi:hypothetical protein